MLVFISNDNYFNKSFVILVPNIPFWTGLNKVRPMTGVARGIGLTTITGNGGVEPFVNVSIHGLLWGYPGSDVRHLSEKFLGRGLI